MRRPGILAGLVAALALTACETEPPPRTVDMTVVDADMPASPDLAPPDLSGPLEFADFVISLIYNQSSGTSLPTTTEDKTFVDSMDPAAFDSLF